MHFMLLDVRTGAYADHRPCHSTYSKVFAGAVSRDGLGTTGKALAGEEDVKVATDDLIGSFSPWSYTKTYCIPGERTAVAPRLCLRWTPADGRGIP
jgi:hypothetical protein